MVDIRGVCPGARVVLRRGVSDPIAPRLPINVFLDIVVTNSECTSEDVVLVALSRFALQEEGSSALKLGGDVAGNGS